MRIVTVEGRAGLLVEGQVFDLAQASGGAISPQPLNVLGQHWEAVRALAENGSLSGGVPVEQVHLGAPVPVPGTVFAIGLNYQDHSTETGRPVTYPPAIFVKFSTSVVGPYDDVVLPAAEQTADHEAELAFVVGRGGRHIKAADAYDHLAGFCIGQDISERRLQRAAGGQFCLGKSFDTFCPLGPALVTLDELDDPADLRVVCRVNGDIRQSDTTAALVVDVPHLVELLSSVATLRPGDVCLTGTPAGVGAARTPPQFLQAGDVIETEISGLGLMRNRCVAEQV